MLLCVFTKRFADEICGELDSIVAPYGALEYHSDLSREERKKAYEDYSRMKASEL